MLIRRRKAVNSKHAAHPHWTQIETICWRAATHWGGTHRGRLEWRGWSMCQGWVRGGRVGRTPPWHGVRGEGAVEGGGGGGRGWLCLSCSALNTFAQSSGHCSKVRRLHLQWRRGLPEWASLPLQHGRAALQNEWRPFSGKRWGLCARSSQGGGCGCLPPAPPCLQILSPLSLRGSVTQDGRKQRACLDALRCLVATVLPFGRRHTCLLLIVLAKVQWERK